MYKALIVDDEPLMREYLMSNLSVIHSKWLASSCMQDGFGAIKLLKTDKFDAVITDIAMPNMDGLELAQYVYNHCPNIFTIILSGYDEFDYARTAVRLDVSDYLLKPLNDKELYDVLERIAVTIEMRKDTKIPNGISKTFSLDNVSQQFRDYLSTVTGTGTEKKGTLTDRATEYICQHFCKPIALSDVAEELNVSPAYLSYVFHTVKGESYSNFLLRLRMERAALLLEVCPYTKVYNVAEHVGYASAKHFIGVFKKYFGVTPQEYRERVAMKSQA